MAEKRSMEQQAANKALEAFLRSQVDVSSVTEVEQRLQIHIAGTAAYIPSYTRQVMDRNHGAPVMAVYTRTEKDSKKVFIEPAANPKDKRARQLRSDETMGPAYFAFGVPLRKLQLKFPVSRRLILPLNTLEVPGQGTVYWVSFDEFEKEARDIDLEAVAAARQAKAEAAQAKKAARAAARAAKQQQAKPTGAAQT